MSYFEESQKLRREIENDRDICVKIKAFEKRGLELEFMASGGRNSHYRLGQLPSGLWIALRESVGYERGEFEELGLIGCALYETYCQEAERFHERGKRVPLSVGGYIKEIETPFLVVEDLGEGKNGVVFGTGCSNSRGYIERDGKREEVWFDLGKDDTLGMESITNKRIDGLFDIRSLKYFHPTARINL